jgi:hypothetical protein
LLNICLDISYEIKVYTSNIFNGGTDANVHIEIYGIEKTTGKVLFCNETERKGKFQVGSIDTFVLQLVDVGNIKKIRIGHDNSGWGKDYGCTESENNPKARYICSRDKRRKYYFVFIKK